MTKKKIIAYIDGYNLYEGCRETLKKQSYECYEELNEVMWYDVREIVRHCGNFEETDDITVWFYTSKPRKGGKKYLIEHYERFQKALKGIQVKVIEGKFKPRAEKVDFDSFIEELQGVSPEFALNERERKTFKESLDSFLNATKPREKQTDVNLAIDMIRHAYEETVDGIDYDTIVLVSADSDFVPVIKRIIAKKPAKEILVLLPPNPIGRKNQFLKDFENSEKQKFECKRININDIKENCQLKEERKTYAIGPRKSYEKSSPLEKYPYKCGIGGAWGKCEWNKCYKKQKNKNP